MFWYCCLQMELPTASLQTQELYQNSMHKGLKPGFWFIELLWFVFFPCICFALLSFLAQNEYDQRNSHQSQRMEGLTYYKTLENYLLKLMSAW